jgi:hypothetical protein
MAEVQKLNEQPPSDSQIVLSVHRKLTFVKGNEYDGLEHRVYKKGTSLCIPLFDFTADRQPPSRRRGGSGKRSTTRVVRKSSERKSRVRGPGFTVKQHCNIDELQKKQKL